MGILNRIRGARSPSAPSASSPSHFHARKPAAASQRRAVRAPYGCRTCRRSRPRSGPARCAGGTISCSRSLDGTHRHISEVCTQGGIRHTRQEVVSLQPFLLRQLKSVAPRLLASLPAAAVPAGRVDLTLDLSKRASVDGSRHVTLTVSLRTASDDAPETGGPRAPRRTAAGGSGLRRRSCQRSIGRS